jgi:hypothetical protein
MIIRYATSLALAAVILSIALLGSCRTTEQEVAPEAPEPVLIVTGLEASQAAFDKLIEVTWNAGPDPVVLYRSDSPDGDYLMHLSPTWSTYFSDSAVTPDREYWYKAAYFDPVSWEEGVFTEPVRGSTRELNPESFITPIPADGSWVASSFEPGRSQWFYVDVESPGEYTLWIDDADGSGAYQGDLLVDIYAQDRTNTYYSEPRDSGYEVPLLISVPEGQKQLYLSASTKPERSGQAAFRILKTPSLLPDETWTPLEGVGSSGTWMLLDAEPGVLYDIWWDDAGQGSGRYTADVNMYGFHLDGSEYFVKVPHGYEDPYSIRVSRTERRVLLFADLFESDSGDFAVKISPAPVWGVIEILFDGQFETLTVTINGKHQSMVDSRIGSRSFGYDGELSSITVSDGQSSASLESEALKGLQSVRVTSSNEDRELVMIPEP